MPSLSTADIYAILVDEHGRRVLPNGNWVTLGDRVTLDKTPCQVQCHPYTVYPHAKGMFSVGCVVQPLAYWERAEDPDELSEHPECEPWSNYRDAITLVAKWMRANGMGE